METATLINDLIDEYLELHAEPHIRQRGRDYYYSNAVTECSSLHSSGRREFSVIGTDSYWVSFVLDADKRKPISAVSCTCPYSGWGICKHVVASMICIQEEANELKIKSKVVPKTEKTENRKPRRAKPKLRSAKANYIIKNFEDLSFDEHRDHFTGNLNNLSIYQVELDHQGDQLFFASLKVLFEQRWIHDSSSVMLEVKGEDLAVSCYCGEKVEKLCVHGYLLVEYLDRSDILSGLRRPSGTAIELMAAAKMVEVGFESSDEWPKYFELVYQNSEWSLEFKKEYGDLISPDALDEKVLLETFAPNKKNGISTTTTDKDDKQFEVGFAIGFPGYKEEIVFDSIIATADRKGNLMKQGFALLSKSRYNKNILYSAADQPLIALSQLLSGQSYYDNSLPIDQVELIRLNKERLSGHPYLYFHSSPRSQQLRKSDLTPIRFIDESPGVTYRPRQEGEFIFLDVFVDHHGVELSLSADNAILVHSHFLKVDDSLYFLSAGVDARHLNIAQQLAGRAMLTSQFPAFFEKYLKRALESNSLDLSGLPSFSLTETTAKAVSREIYLTEEGQTVFFRPVLRCEGDVLMNALAEKADWTMEEQTMQRTNLDEAAAESYRALLSEIFPDLESRKSGDWIYMSYQDLQKDHFLIKAVERFAEADIKIYGVKDLKGLRVSPYAAKVSYSVSSKIDWFEVEMEMAWGDTVIGIDELKKRFVPGNDYVELGDGSRGMLPTEWIKKLERLFGHGQIVKGNLEISDKKFSIVDELFDQIEDADTLDFIQDRKSKLLKTEWQQERPLPRGIKAKLRHYQKDGFQWMTFLDSFQWGGILADDMGLGKTLQVIVFLKHILASSKQANLIVVPTSLLFNWENELRKFAPSLKTHFHYGVGREKSTKAFDKKQIVLTSYGHMLSDIEFLKDFHFNYVILDESQAIKNPASKRYKAARLLKANNRLAMTGTPIENNTFDLYAQMSFLNPGLLGSAKSFKENYAKPIDTGRDAEKAAELQRLIKPFILRRTKEQVATELPDKTEEVLYCEMGRAQRKVYDAHRNKYRDILTKKLDEDGLNKSRFAVLEGLTKLRQICDSPALLPGEEKYSGDAEKIELLMMHITEKTANHKILIFSQFVKMLRIIESRIIDEGIPYAYLDGQSNTKQRQASVDRFQNEEDCRVFLISLKAGGTGLNLMAADYVYIVDPWWNPAVENQAIDRCYRIGQDKKVIAYRMICKDTVEEKIMDLKQKKKAIAGEIITTDEGVLKKLTKDDLMGLFR